MSSGGKKFVVRTLAGKEYGPANQEALIRWAEAGRITAFCEVRSTLLSRWETAKNLSFLRDIFERQLAESQSKIRPSLWGKLKARIRLRAVEVRRTSGLVALKAQDFESALPILRIACGLTDALILVLYLVVVYLAMAFLYSNGMSATAAFYLGVVLGYFGGMMYFPWMISFHTQTLGQKFWGVLVVRTTDREMYLGRAFLYTIATLMFGFLTPFTMYIAPSGQALQDILSDTRVVRTKLVPKK